MNQQVKNNCIGGGFIISHEAFEELFPDLNAYLIFNILSQSAKFNGTSETIEGKTIYENQTITSYESLAEKVSKTKHKITKKAAREAVERLVERGYITIESWQHRFTVVTIIKGNRFVNEGKNEETGARCGARCRDKKGHTETVVSQGFEGDEGHAEKSKRGTLRGTILRKEENIIMPDKSGKNIFGSFENVLLTDTEYEKLKEKFPDYEERIETLSEYIASKGKRYKSHYATILSWARREEKPKEQPQKAEDKTIDWEGMKGLDY